MPDIANKIAPAHSVPKTFLTALGDRIEIMLTDGKPVLSAAAGPLIMAARFEPAEFREFGRAMVAMADRADGRELARDAQLILTNLVDALEHTNWSSWQTTARFQAELDAAREFLQEVPA